MKIALTVLASAFALAVLGWLAFGFFGIQALFVDEEVEEKIPDLIAELQRESEIGSDFAESLLGRGHFQQGDSTYTISGEAFLTMIDGDVTLTLADFSVSNGPDLFLYAVKAESTDNAAVKAAVARSEFVNLGALKGNIGSQSYVLGAEFDPVAYPVIGIWCRRFSRNFGSALLRTDEP